MYSFQSVFLRIGGTLMKMRLINNASIAAKQAIQAKIIIIPGKR